MTFVRPNLMRPYPLSGPMLPPTPLHSYCVIAQLSKASALPSPLSVHQDSSQARHALSPSMLFPSTPPPHCSYCFLYL